MLAFGGGVAPGLMALFEVRAIPPLFPVPGRNADSLDLRGTSVVMKIQTAQFRKHITPKTGGNGNRNEPMDFAGGERPVIASLVDTR
jgi:hypothetical protein